MQLLQIHIRSRGSGTVNSNVPGASDLQPDESFGPLIGVPPPGVAVRNWVTLVIEVKRWQSLQSVRNKARRWLNETTCLEVVIISISPQRRSLRAEVWQAGAAANPVQSLPFGGNHCTALGQQVMQITLASIFGGAVYVPPAVVAAFPAGTIPIDLYPVKQAILAAE